MKIPKNCKLPSWFTLQPQEDGTYQSMDEPMIKEMLSVYAERLPKYYQENLSEFRSREVEGLCHGDFHTGNHMFGGKDGEEDKVIVYDFQGAGPGLVSKEVVRMLACMEIENYDQVLEITKGTIFKNSFFFFFFLSILTYFFMTCPFFRVSQFIGG